MVRRLLLAATLALAAGAQQSGPPKRPERYALLVGNGLYQSLPHLPAAAEEAGALDTALHDAGFKVTHRDNLKRQEYIDALTRFLEPVQEGDAVFFYFSGYAAEVDGDDNYLLPVDFDANGAGQMAERAIQLKAVQQRLDRKSKGLKMIVLEAPHALNVSIRGATEAGVQRPNPDESHETLLAFAATPGQTVQATAGIGRFTQQVAGNIRKPGLPMRGVFEEAKVEVARLTDDRQRPLVSDNVTATAAFYFHDPIPVVAPPPTKEVVTKVEIVEAPLHPPFTASNSRDHEDYEWIPKGDFKMGCVSGDQHCLANENPQHPVSIAKNFWMGRNEVQVSSYQRYLKAQSGQGKKKLSMPGAPGDYNRWNIPAYPMVNVSWQDAKGYCAWAGGRLPTEAEWEYAARAGQDAIYPFEGGNSRDKANFAGKQGADIFDRVAPVHSFGPNAWGLHDMAGNVWEWVSDNYTANYYRESPGADPQGPQEGKDHVMRGGSFDSLPDSHLRISVRKAGGVGNDVGFRCILEDTPATNKLLGR
jgi:formylglycine-generating enzyme required for sulfatase activity